MTERIYRVYSPSRGESNYVSTDRDSAVDVAATLNEGYIVSGMEGYIDSGMEADWRVEVSPVYWRTETEDAEAIAYAESRKPRPRLKSCVAEWPECAEGEYHPSCCRFPKSCSCTVYRDGIDPDFLESRD